MSSNNRKILLGRRGGELKKEGWISAYIKPTGKFWKRYFNKKVRQGKDHKRGNWFDWS